MNLCIPYTEYSHCAEIRLIFTMLYLQSQIIGWTGLYSINETFLEMDVTHVYHQRERERQHKITETTEFKKFFTIVLLS